ncbi:MAG: GC-type dockerin domain-anchored protein [Phycisphaerales bacterium JB040]
MHSKSCLLISNNDEGSVSRLSILHALGIVILAAAHARAQSDPGDFSTVINIPQDTSSIGGSLSPDTQLNLSAGGFVEYGFDIGAFGEENANIEMNVYGGHVDDYLSAYANTALNIFGGSIGDHFRAGDSKILFSGGEIGEDAALFSGAVLDMLGGTMGTFFEVNQGAVFNLSGGTVGSSFAVDDGGEVNTHGGLIRTFRGYSGSTANLFGGKTRGSFWSLAGSTLNIYGGDFKFNGTSVDAFPIGGLGGTGGSGDFYGVFQNGDAFVFSTGSRGDKFEPNTVALNLVQLPDVDLVPIFVAEGTSPVNSIRPGQALVLSGTGSIPDHFRMVGALLELDGGTIGEELQAAEAEIVMQGGVVGRAMYLAYGCEFVMTGGQVGDRFRFGGESFELINGSIGANFSLSSSDFTATQLITGGTIGEDANFWSSTIQRGGVVGESAQISGLTRYTMTGGEMGPGLVVAASAVFDVQGGRVGVDCTVNSGGSLIISGGQFDPGLRAVFSSSVEIRGNSFSLDGEPLGLELGESMVLDVRDVLLTCNLADGTFYSLSLDSSGAAPGQDFVDSTALLTVTGSLSANCPPDINFDNVVDQGDIQAFIGYFLDGNGGVDLNGDGVLDLGDISAFVAAFLAGC